MKYGKYLVFSIIAINVGASDDFLSKPDAERKYLLTSYSPEPAVLAKTALESDYSTMPDVHSPLQYFECYNQRFGKTCMAASIAQTIEFGIFKKWPLRPTIDVYRSPLYVAACYYKSGAKSWLPPMPSGTTVGWDVCMEYEGNMDVFDILIATGAGVPAYACLNEISCQVKCPKGEVNCQNLVGYSSGAVACISNFESKRSNIDRNVDIMKAIQRHGAVVASIYMSGALTAYRAIDGEQVLESSGPVMMSGKRYMLHYVSICGWNKSSISKPYWLIRNSWGGKNDEGKSWGLYTNVDRHCIGSNEMCGYGKIKFDVLNIGRDSYYIQYDALPLSIKN